MTQTEALRLTGISKYFGPVKALDGIDMIVRSETIHAILGENGAGKTTLMSVLFGLYQPDSGQIFRDGHAVRIASPRQAIDAGIGMIHQHLMLVESLTVAENVALGLPDRGMHLRLDDIRTRLAQLSTEFGFDIDPDQPVWKLPLGMRQRVEILKVLFRDIQILILDEPTSVLAPDEIAGFLRGLERLRAAGRTILFITHKLDEVAAVADRVTVMRHGRIVGEGDIAEFGVAQMAQLMVGRDMVLGGLDRGSSQPGEVVMRAEGLTAKGKRNTTALRDVSFELRAGEILGVAGVDGNGQAELAEVICGLTPAISGRLTLSGKDITHASVDERRHIHHLAYVPEDRHHTGLVLDFSVAQNAVLRDYRRAPFSRHGILDRSAMQRAARDWTAKYDVRMRDIDQPVRYLSGGNQQKLIFAREVECDPRVLVVMQPCKGLDVGAIEAVQRTILAERARGKAILYISTELEHILDVADRVAVMCAGEIVGVLDPDEATPERIGPLMGGHRGTGAA